jgi:hypothetical protein
VIRKFKKYPGDPTKHEMALARIITAAKDCQKGKEKLALKGIIEICKEALK